MIFGHRKRIRGKSRTTAKIECESGSYLLAARRCLPDFLLKWPWDLTSTRRAYRITRFLSQTERNMFITILRLRVKLTYLRRGEFRRIIVEVCVDSSIVTNNLKLLLTISLTTLLVVGF
ncbi:uncharacterized protein LOC131649558 [Vicia villosa]|uniref:uncharacterized protein LOC131649558 n=1 Tax=Vicia villosa TaxID=3911 RepID=UPI00273AB549|nr:uncharacterized protein LOC131649558 [Vicia villosa]